MIVTFDRMSQEILPPVINGDGKGGRTPFSFVPNVIRYNGQKPYFEIAEAEYADLITALSERGILAGHTVHDREHISIILRNK